MNPQHGHRIASLFLATALTALVLGSQLGVAQHYTSQADEQLAAAATTTATAAVLPVAPAA